MMIKYNYYHSIHTTHGWNVRVGKEDETRRRITHTIEVNGKEKRRVDEGKGGNEKEKKNRRRVNQEKKYWKRISHQPKRKIKNYLMGGRRRRNEKEERKMQQTIH